MTDIIEPINFLRDCIISYREIILGEGNKELLIKLEDSQTPLKLPVDLNTAWTRNDGKGFYTLGALWFWVQNRSMRQPDYIRASNQAGLPPVLLPDRDDVVEYLTGKKPRSNAINEMVRGETMIKRSQLKAGKVVAVGGSAQEAKKREVKAEEKRATREKKVCEII